MNINEYIEQQQQLINPSPHISQSDIEYVTRSEMAQVIVTIVQHYEKRIQALETGYSQVIQSLQASLNNQQPSLILSQSSSKANILQPNLSVQNCALKKDARTSEIMSTENSESSLQVPIVTASLKHFSQQNLIDEIQQIISIKQPPMSTKSIQKQQNKSTGNAVTSFIKPSAKENSHENILQISQILYNDANSTGMTGSKNRQKTALVESASKAGKTLSLKKDNYSEIKGKISMFNLQQFQSPSDAASFSQLNQHSPDERESNITAHVGANANYLIQSEFANKYISYSPDSIREGMNNSHTIGANPLSAGKTSKQMISICTQDYQITELQSPLQDSRMQKSEASNQKTNRNTIQKVMHQKSQNAIYQNGSLSILQEEDSQQIQTANATRSHLVSIQNHLQPELITSKTVKDQRLSLGLASSTNQMKPILERDILKQRSTTSIGSKSGLQLSTVSQQTFQTQQPNSQSTKSNQKLNKSYNAHCIIQKNQRNKSLNNYNSRQQEILQRQYELTQSQNNTFGNEKNRQSLGSDQKNEMKKKIAKKTQHIHNKKAGITANKNITHSTLQNHSAHNSNKNPQQIDQSLAKILMPQFASDRLLLKIKTPIGNSRTKAQNQVNSFNNENTNSIVGNKIPTQMNTIDVPSKDQIKKPFEIQPFNDLQEIKQNLRESKTFDQSTKEPLTMRDLEIIEENQFRLSTLSNQIELGGTRVFDEKDNTSSFQHIEISKKNSLHSSMVIQSSRQPMNQSSAHFLQTNSQSDLSSQLHSGSLTQRDQQQQNNTSSQTISSTSNKKRTACSRIAGTSAESRLSNLVQTIQKYKNEAGINEEQTNSSSLLKLYGNFETIKEHEFKSTLATSARFQESQESFSKCQKDQNSQSERSNSTHSQKSLNQERQMESDNQSQRSNNQLQDLMAGEEYEDIQIDKLEIGQEVIRISSKNLMQSIESSKEDQISFKNEQPNQKSSQKSRNLPQNYQQEYFSFSNLEGHQRQKQIDDGYSSESTCRLGSSREEKSNRLERSETMIKLTLDKESFRKFQKTTKFDDLPGDVLDLISEFLPNSDKQVPPAFVLCNSFLLRSYAGYKKENYAIQIEILIDQIGELKRELFDYFEQKLFRMSKGLSIIYYSNINSKEWNILEELCKEKNLNKDDQTLMRVYFLLLGQKPKPTSNELHEQLYKLISEHKNKLNSIFNPELHFTFGPQILCQVGKQFSVEKDKNTSNISIDCI